MIVLQMKDILKNGSWQECQSKLVYTTIIIIIIIINPSA